VGAGALRAGQVVGVRLVDGPAVDENPAVPELECLPGQAYDPLDEVTLRVFRVLEHDDVAAADRAHRQD